ncbi:hypothetical protein GGI07_002729 [Coemansia sp. Benny D115]|nr:hypothetical protein GGI07_002729 [Coemansia sp. Benny D115]
MFSENTDDGKAEETHLGRRLSRARTLRRTLIGDWPQGLSLGYSRKNSLWRTPENKDTHRNSSAVADVRQSEDLYDSGPPTSLIELLRPTSGAYSYSTAAEDTSSIGSSNGGTGQTEKSAQQQRTWRRPKRFHALRMLQKLGSVSPLLGSSSGGLGRRHGLFQNNNEYPESDDPSTGQSAVERKRRVDALFKQSWRLAQGLGTSALSRMSATMILSQMQWDVEAALRRVQAILCSRDGIVFELNPLVKLSGVVNSCGTSCYIDSLVVALFGVQQSCDGLLYMRDLGNEQAAQMQAVLRLIVNVLRTGDLVDAALMEELRSALIRCGWLATDRYGGGGSAVSAGSQRYSQQDAGELYLFLMETLRMPCLPLQVRMVHGADSDEADNRMSTQRVLEVSLPPPDTSKHPESPDPDRPVLLQELLEKHFFDNRVEQLERKLTAAAKEDQREQVSVRINAWSMLSLLPFYTPQNETGDMAAEYPQDAPLIVPILVKRYATDDYGNVHRVKRRVIMPLVLDATSIISTNSDGLLDDPKDRPPSSTNRTANGNDVPPPWRPEQQQQQQRVQYRLVLRAAVCHKGSTAHSGHYISFGTRLRLARPEEIARQQMGVCREQQSLPVAPGPVHRVHTLEQMSAPTPDVPQPGDDESKGSSGQKRAALRRCHSWPLLNKAPPEPKPEAGAETETETTPVIVSEKTATRMPTDGTGDDYEYSNLLHQSPVPAESTHVVGTAAEWARYALSTDLLASSAPSQQELQHAYLEAVDQSMRKHVAAAGRAAGVEGALAPPLGIAMVGEILRFDDMDVARGRARSFDRGAGVRGCLDEIATDGYLAFYVLQRVETGEDAVATEELASRDDDDDGGGDGGLAAMGELAQALHEDGHAELRGLEDMALRWQNIRADRLASPVGPLRNPSRPPPPPPLPPRVPQQQAHRQTTEPLARDTREHPHRAHRHRLADQCIAIAPAYAFAVEAVSSLKQPLPLSSSLNSVVVPRASISTKQSIPAYETTKQTVNPNYELQDLRSIFFSQGCRSEGHRTQGLIDPGGRATLASRESEPASQQQWLLDADALSALYDTAAAVGYDHDGPLAHADVRKNADLDTDFLNYSSPPATSDCDADTTLDGPRTSYILQPAAFSNLSCDSTTTNTNNYSRDCDILHSLNQAILATSKLPDKFFTSTANNNNNTNTTAPTASASFSDSLFSSTDTLTTNTPMPSNNSFNINSDSLFDSFVASEYVASQPPAMGMRSLTDVASASASASRSTDNVFATPLVLNTSDFGAFGLPRVPATAPMRFSTYTAPPAVSGTLASFNELLASAYDSYLSTPVNPANMSSPHVRVAPAQTTPRSNGTTLFAPLDELKAKEQQQQSADALLGQLANSDPAFRQSLVHAIVDYINPAVAYQSVNLINPVSASSSSSAAASSTLLAQAQTLMDAAAPLVDGSWQPQTGFASAAAAFDSTPDMTSPALAGDAALAAGVEAPLLDSLLGLLSPPIHDAMTPLVMPLATNIPQTAQTPPSMVVMAPQDVFKTPRLPQQQSAKAAEPVAEEGDEEDDEDALPLALHLASAAKAGSAKRRRDAGDEDSQPGAKRQFHCDICNRGFSRQYNMRTHRLTHEPQSVKARQFLCSECPKTFTRKHDLVRHLVLHDDTGAFKCPVCSRGFARLDVLKRHENAVHKDMPETDCLATVHA